MATTAPHSSPLAVLAPFGAMLTLGSLTMLPPIGVELLYRDGSIAPFADSFWLMLLTGLALWLPFRRVGLELQNRQGIVVVVAVWISVCAMSALPFLLAERPTMSFIDALFESTSGLTTTGATVLPALDGLPHSILYYRAQLNFIGGIGIVVLAVAVLPMIGIGGMQLYRAETPGPFKDEKLTPRIKETAKRLSIIYLVLVVLCALAFWAAGMNAFDAIAHSFATLALGGFSTHSDSLGYFNSPAIELVAAFFSLVAGINFGLIYMSWYRWSLSPLLNWPAPIALLLIMGSFFGGCVGSTCGGIKAMRFLLLIKQSLHEIRLLIHPHGRFFVKIGPRPIPERAMQAVWGFYFLYVFVFCSFSLAITATGVDIVSAFGSMAGCLNNMGVGFGVTAPHFGALNDTAKWLLTLAMLLGRLELFPLLMLLTPTYWKS
jgi:trk system potassium uptake protein TrkH